MPFVAVVCHRVRLARERELVVLAFAVTFVLLASLAEAAGITVAWDRNPESDISGYEILYGTASGSYTQSVRVGANVQQTRIESLQAGRRYYIVVRARNSAGLVSPNSNEVSGVASDPAAAPPEGARQTYFAEGASGFFNYRLALLNTGGATTANVTFMPENGQPFTRSYSLPAGARATITASDLPQLNGASFAASVSALPSVVAERTMRWRIGPVDGAHSAKALVAPARNWYLAEGNAGFFDTFILLSNPNSSAATATVRFMLEDGEVVRREYEIAPRGRTTVWANEIRELASRSFATSVSSSSNILVERAMYFRSTNGYWEGGHGSAAVPAGARNWFLAEGATGGWFETFVLINNPNSSEVTATIRYLTPRGVARTETRTLPPTSRTTIHVDRVPGLQNTEVSCSISASANIIVERSMYWPGLGGPWYGSHNSVGVTSLGRRWVLAEGEVGGADNAQTYVLLANPGSSDASVTLTFHRSNGAEIPVTRTVRAGSRLTVSAADVGLRPGEQFGVVIESTQPIAVERSMYWNYRGALWTSGTNESAAPLP